MSSDTYTFHGKEYEYAFYGRFGISDILKQAVNNRPLHVKDNNWWRFALGKLYFENIYRSFDKYDNTKSIDFDFIDTEKQWLMVYQLFVELRYTIFRTTKRLVLGYEVPEVSSNNLESKAYITTFIRELTSLCKLPKIEPSWFEFFQTLNQESEIIIIKHPTADDVIFDNKRNSLIDSQYQPNNLITDDIVDWFDILAVTITHQAYNKVKHLIDLEFRINEHAVVVSSF